MLMTSLHKIMNQLLFIKIKEIFMLGIELARTPDGIFLCQRKYALDILQDTGYLASNPTNTPMTVIRSLLQQTLHSFMMLLNTGWLVGQMIYLTIAHPDIAYSLQTLSQYMSEPTEKHWLKHIWLQFIGYYASSNRVLVTVSSSQFRFSTKSLLW